MTAFVLLWAGYALILVFIAKYSRSHDALLPGKVGVAVQALAYVATYISAVALVGFGGLCYLFGLQMLLVAARRRSFSRRLTRLRSSRPL